jgi:hypothetical protein
MTESEILSSFEEMRKALNYVFSVTDTYGRPLLTRQGIDKMREALSKANSLSTEKEKETEDEELSKLEKELWDSSTGSP